MDQAAIGRFIALRRKEKNLTQEQLAGKIGVSNKTVSKWETGKCMPDYGIIEALCRELEITLSELMDGEEKETCSIRVYDDKQILDMLERIQRLEKQKQSLLGIVLIAVGIALLALSQFFGGTAIEDVFSGILFGISVGEILIGVYITAGTWR